MIATIINFILFFILYFWYVRNHKWLSPPSLLLLIYVIVAFMGVLYYPDYSLKNRILFWPYLYLFSVISLFILPILKTDVSIKKIKSIKLNKTIKVLVFFYVFFAVVSIIRYTSIAYQAITLGDWFAVKRMAMEGELGISGGLIYTMAKAYTVAFMPAMVVYAFLSFVNQKDKILKSLFLLIIAILPDVLSSIINVYRGGFLTLSLLLFSFVMLFKDIMPVNKRRFLYLLMGLSGILIILLNYSITVSRFGDDNSSNSLIVYAGQPMLVFNGGIAATIENFANGAYFFQNFNKLSRDQIWIDAKFGTSTYDGSALNTFVGCSYIDFGPYLTLAIALFVSLVIRKILTSGALNFSKLYLYTFYLNYLFLGAFHSSMGFSMNVIVACFFYYIINRSLNNNYKIQKIYGC